MNSQAAWQRALPTEVEFWRQIISGEALFPQHLTKYMPPNGTARILDVRSALFGMASINAKGNDWYAVEIIPAFN